MERRSARGPQRSEVSLEEELDDLNEILFKFCRPDDSDLSKTKDELRTLSSNIRSTNTKYSKVVFELDSLKSRCGVAQERKELMDSFDNVQQMYKKRMHAIRLARESVGDDSISEMSSVLKLPSNSVNPNEKCSFYVEHQASIDESRITATPFLSPLQQIDQLDIADLSPIPNLLNCTRNNVMPVPSHSNIVKPLYTSNNTSVPMYPNSIEQSCLTISQAHSSKFQSIETEASGQSLFNYVTSCETQPLVTISTSSYTAARAADLGFSSDFKDDLLGSNEQNLDANIFFNDVTPKAPISSCIDAAPLSNSRLWFPNLDSNNLVQTSVTSSLNSNLVPCSKVRFMSPICESYHDLATRENGLVPNNNSTFSLNDNQVQDWNNYCSNKYGSSLSQLRESNPNYQISNAPRSYPYHSNNNIKSKLFSNINNSSSQAHTTIQPQLRDLNLNRPVQHDRMLPAPFLCNSNNYVHSSNFGSNARQYSSNHQSAVPIGDQAIYRNSVSSGVNTAVEPSDCAADSVSRPTYAPVDPNSCLVTPTRLSLHFNPLLPANNSVHSSVLLDSTARMLIKQQMLSKTYQSDLYKGEATKFYGFIHKFRSKIRNLGLDAYEIIEVLGANCEGKPKEIVGHFEYSAYRDGEEALDAIWKDLYNSFGLPKHVRAEIRSMIKNVGHISSKEDINHMKKLLQVCQLISVNMRHEVDSLITYDTEDGQSEIFDLFPNDLFNKWRRIVKLYEGRCPSFGRLVDFIKDVIDEVSALDHRVSRKPTTNAKSFYVQSDSRPRLPVNEESKKEKYCARHKSNSHDLSECREFLSVSPQDRAQYVQSNYLCFKCFLPHMRKFCSFIPHCEKCNGPHQTSMHDTDFIQNLIANRDVRNSEGEVSARDNNSRVSEPSEKQQHSDTSLWGSCSGHTASYSKVLLVSVSSTQTGKSTKCYAIVDEQSSRSFILPALADILEVDGTDVDYTLTTMNGLKNFTSGKKIEGLHIKGENEIKSYALPPVVTNSFIPDCTNEVATPDIIGAHPHVRRFSKFFCPLDKSAEVMILLGRDSHELMKTKCLTEKAPFVHKTCLGYALVGSFEKCNSNNNVTALRTSEHFSMEECLPKVVDKFLLVDKISDSLVRLPDDELLGLSQDEMKFDNILRAGTCVNKTSNIEMPLPFHNLNQVMPDNKKPVYARTRNTLKRLALNEDRLKKCCSVMGKYLEKNHVEQVPWDEQEPMKGKAWWVPVFCVVQLKKGKADTKVRLVFDSSASYQGISLNDVLLQGPDRNNSLRGVLMRFRNGIIAVSSDIEAMFHSFHLSESDRDYVRFFWFKNNDPEMPIVQFRARVQVFGNKPSPAIANHGLRCAINHPMQNDCSELSKNIVMNNIYVDDALAAFDDQKQAISAISGAKEKLAKFQIRLHKVASNCKDVVNAFPESEIAEEYSSETRVVCGALGLLWDVDSDEFQFKINLPSKEFTPRGVLSINHSVFDPLGFLSPVILKGRLLQREMFSVRQGCPKGVAVNWDEPLSEDFLGQWSSFKDSLSDLDSVTFPRSYYPEKLVPITKQEMHVFSDASFDGLGYAIYVRTFGNGKVHSSLAFAGSKVAPRAATSIPRLELNAALEASVAALKVKEELRMEFSNIYYHCDSQVVIGYLSNREKRFSRYVSRRIEIINNMCNNRLWNYVESGDNPADLASRPQSAEVLKTSMWLHGPDFLSNVKYEVNDFVPTTLKNLPEECIDIQCNKVKVENCDGVFKASIERCSRLPRLLGVVKRVLSLFNCLDKARQRLGISLAPRSPGPEICRDKAIFTVIKDSQTEVDIVTKYDDLSPFMDSDGLWRVGGRLRNAFIPFDNKHPVILPKEAGLARLMVDHYHKKVKHQGRFITHSALRLAGYFIPAARKLVSSVIKSCAICRHLRGRPCMPKMADLPPDRLEESPCFTTSGLDMFGPFNVTEGQTTRRNSSTKKVYGLVFICSVTRAVHIEAVPGMDTSSMINALRRFFAVRGVCRHLRSDNGSNFVAACKEIGALPKLRIETEKHDCTWIFNPPGASHMGGSWERAIGSIRKIMNASLLLLGNRAISRDEINTLFQEAAFIINNTPMYEMSNYPDDPISISPANLLTLKDAPNPSPAEHFSESDLDFYGLKRWKRVQCIADEFWKRWRSEYLSQLQSRCKWTKNRPNLVVGDIVIIKDKQLARNDWPTGAIERVSPSKDGVIRSCEVRTAHGYYRRAVCDLVLLTPAECRVSRL